MATSTLIGVVYSIAQARVRRWYVPTDDKELTRLLLSPGEALLTYPRSQGHSLAVVQDKVKKQTGRDPDDDNCAVVDPDGNIICQVKADPSIDSHPAGELIATYGPVPNDAIYQKTAARGGSSSGTFTYVIPDMTIPAGTRKQDGSLTTVDIFKPGSTVEIAIDDSTKSQTVTKQ